MFLCFLHKKAQMVCKVLSAVPDRTTPADEQTGLCHC